MVLIDFFKRYDKYYVWHISLRHLQKPLPLALAIAIFATFLQLRLGGDECCVQSVRGMFLEERW
jgi:hypothetical protein